MDAIQLLKDDHDKMRTLLNVLESTTERGVKTREELFATIKGELTIHEVIEEEIFYPALKEHPKAKDIVLEAYEEHHVVDNVMAELEGLDVSDETWGAKAKVMQENVEHHMEEEEGEMFKQARQVFDEKELEELGSRMAARKTEIFIQFKCVPHSIFAARGARTQPNKLVISIQPEENIRLLVMAKTPGLDREGIRLREVPLDVGLANAFADARRRIAYERLLLDLIDGDPTLFVRRDEVEAQWQWIDGVRAAWDEAGLAPKPYGAGSWGPSAAIALTERDGVHWHG